MATFLSGVQDLARECDLASVPSAVTGQTGEFADMVRWYARAYREIQNRHKDWRWLRRTATVSTTASDDTYASSDFTDSTDAAAISRFGSWRLQHAEDPPKIYLSSSGVGNERWLVYTPWDWFKSIYKIGTQNTGTPAHITVDPNNNILLGPSPNDTYVVTVDYYMSSQELAANSDTPEMPARFHDLIVYRALEKYAYRESASEVLMRAQTEARRLMRQLEADQLECPYFGGPLA